jgi:outer membrane protein assembly factor BamE (lipoprotein component of BamABCDE complex)
MDKIKISIIILVTIFLCLFIRKQIDGKKNESNFSKLEIGMQKEEVVKIMGKPNSKNKGRGVGTDSIYFYQPRFASSSGLEIEFDSLGIVINLLNDN